MLSEHINKRQNAKTKLENTLKFRTIQRKVDFIDGQQERSGGIDKVGRSTANKLRCDLICKRTFCRVAHFSNFISPLVFLAILSRCPPESLIHWTIQISIFHFTSGAGDLQITNTNGCWYHPSHSGHYHFTSGHYHFTSEQPNLHQRSLQTTLAQETRHSCTNGRCRYSSKHN